MANIDHIRKLSPEFIAYLQDNRGKISTPSPSDPNVGARLGHIAGSGGGFTGRDFERVIGRNDLLRSNYLKRGELAAAAVGRIDVPSEFGSSGSWGTGFLITPRLMITNNHVIPKPEDAKRAVIELGYERDENGQFKISRRFRLDPDSAFITVDMDDLDFTLVAVMVRSEDGVSNLDEFGFLRLDKGRRKVQVGEFVTIIQHPNGEEKYIAIRENQVLQIGGDGDGFRKDFLWYVSDTAPGSSGSPVFNDDWQVVALHHSGVPVTEMKDGVLKYQRTSGEWITHDEARDLPDDLLKWHANEGIRVSSILARIKELQVGTTNPLIKLLLDDADGIAPLTGRHEKVSIVSPAATSPNLSIVEAAARQRQKVHPLSYYAGRSGYNPDFLGQSIPLPEITDKAKQYGQIAAVQGSENGELRYEHFSIVFNADRRLAFFTAVNIDGAQSVNLTRGSDSWSYDPRLPIELQVGDELYGSEPDGNYFDRGHLVRRLDPVWGDQDTLARANEDTFHWTNCSPQYWEFNQKEILWQGLENFILTNTDQDDLKATVFTGPVFREDDYTHRGLKIPKHFWKVVAVVDGAGRLYSSAYIVSQEKYAKHVPFERLPVGQFNNYQVTVSKLETVTGLSFGSAILASDTAIGQPDAIPLRSLADIRHPRRSGSLREGYGRFASFEAFLESYLRAQSFQEEQEIAPLELEARRVRLRSNRSI
ncbi:DNA/RNA non-specific endonuclease [Methylocucumis oryzae]|uniref:DNA/RNA non-specific endonuclease n=1 Tax=Methylocucumis oryzae TaxID=1632867 RepID=UPI00069772E9|nr:DNA/RNA non-specific endonuclease [Methylocucumis oryzae]